MQLSWGQGMKQKAVGVVGSKRRYTDNRYSIGIICMKIINTINHKTSLQNKE